MYEDPRTRPFVAKQVATFFLTAVGLRTRCVLFRLKAMSRTKNKRTL